MNYQLFLKAAIIVIFVVGIGYILLNDSSMTPSKSPLSQLTINQEATPTPMPFYELTIESLRQRTYQSSLGELNQINQNSDYTSYLTSYTSDNLHINGLLTIPSGQKPAGGWPAIVFVHGYIPPTQYQTLQRYTEYVDFLARNGFVVFKIDLRGHGDSEGEPSGAYYSSDYVTDTLNARAALQTSDFVDHQAVGLWGHSMAGNITLRAAVTQPDIKALVIWGGVGYTYQDIQEYGINDNSYQPQPNQSERMRQRQRLRDLYGNPSDGNPFWKLIAPTNYLKDYKGAIQLHHAQDDTAASIRYSQNLNKILDTTSIPHQFFEYPTGGHNISGVSFPTAMQRTVEFFHTYLK